MKIKRFEDLECWQQARQLTKSAYDHTRKKEFSKDFRLAGQITGAAISIMNNISEGFDAGSNNEFIRFLRYSRRSCSEVQNCLYIALDQNYINEDEFQSNYDQCERIRKMIDGLIKYLRKSRTSEKPMFDAKKIGESPMGNNHEQNGSS